MGKIDKNIGFMEINKSDNKDVSVVVCTRNCEDSIEEVLVSVKNNNPLKIIVVDANSTDKTRTIAKNYATKIFNDPGKGLALARNIGLQEINTKYIFFIGSDNIVGKSTILRLKRYLNQHDYVGTANLTRMKHKHKSYLTRGSDMRWKLRFYEGQREVIGTPYLFKTEILRKFRFDPKMTHSDDSDLCYRLAQEGYKVGYSNIVCWEIGFEDKNSLISRFKRYGKSDYEYYHKYSKNWNTKIKIKSLLHPLKVEFLNPLKKLKLFKKLYYFPYFLLITKIRYKYYIRNLIRKGIEKA